MATFHGRKKFIVFNRSRSIELLKRTVRLVDARFIKRVAHTEFHGTPLTLVKSRFWDVTNPALIAREIGPYFDALTESLPANSVVLDAGAATGQFSILWALKHPDAIVHAFEPSPRQRILLGRNTRLNKVADRIRIHPLGLWDSNTTLAFRTHGDISSVEGATQIPSGFLFTEHVPVMRLDNWVNKEQLNRLDLIKMDIEGAEIEALRGAAQTLVRFKPRLLVQAYHLRDGKRTLEACADWLTQHNYVSREWEQSGLLYAAPVD